MAKTNPINTANPAGSSDPKQGDDYIRTLALAVAEILAVDHYIGASSPYNEDAAGEHAKITLRQAAKPANVADKGFVYTKDVSGTTELFYEDEAGNEIQLTSGGKILLTKNLIANNTAILANKASSGTANLIKLNASDVPEILVGAVLSADTAPATDAAIANKKYVDDTVSGSMSPATYAGEESVTLANGLIMKMGYKASTGTSVAVAFGAAFSAGIVSVMVVGRGSVAHYSSYFVSAQSVSGFTAICDQTADYTGFNWIAIGY
ncbi:MAG: hypothetical protein Q7T18_06755 [Sedimentisphaerales bacterium]|nr:hypothetical protein [Sedimentisphaerales bacterium]